MVKNKQKMHKKQCKFDELKLSVQKFAASHTSLDSAKLSGISTQKRSRKELRKEARKLKKMRIHAFKQGKTLPTVESLEEERVAKRKELLKKRQKQMDKQQARQKKIAMQRKAKEEDEHKEAEYNENKRKDERMLKQLEKSLKMKKNKSSLPAAFVRDGLDYILDAVDPDKIKSVAAEMDAELLWNNDHDVIEAIPPKQSSDKCKNSSMDVDEFDTDASEDDEVMDVESRDADADSDSDRSENDFFQSDDGTDTESDRGEVSDDRTDVKTANVAKADRMQALSELVKNTSADDLDKTKGILKNDNRLKKIASRKEVKFSEMASADTAESADTGSSLEEQQKTMLREDIYGRLRDESGNVVPTSSVVQASSGVYIPPARRQQMLEGKLCDDELASGVEKKQELELLMRQMKGQINRLSDSNVESVGKTIETMYREHSRADTTNVLTTVVLESCLLPSLAPPRVCSDTALLLALLHRRLGCEVSFAVLQKVVTQYCEMFEQLATSQQVGKRIENALTMLAWLFNFKVISCQLLFDIAKLLVNRFGERDIELLLLLLRAAGFGMRKDNPEELKNFITIAQQKANATDVTKLSDPSRIRFFLDTIVNIRSNNDLKMFGVAEKDYVQHLHKLLNIYTKGCKESELRVSLDDVCNAADNGKWFMVGAAWRKPPERGDQRTDSNESTVGANEAVLSAAVSSKLVKKARKIGMNTDMRKSIFYVVASCENYMDGFEKLMQLAARQQQQRQRDVVYREIVHVLFQLCLHESASKSRTEETDTNEQLNLFYIYLLERLSQSHCKRQIKVAVKFTVRHHLQAIVETETKATKVTKLADLVHHLIVKSITGLSVLRDVDFINISKPMQQFVKRLLHSILTKSSDENVEAVFKQIADKPPLLSKQLQLFIKLFFSSKHYTDSDYVELKRRIQLAERAMTPTRLLL